MKLLKGLFILLLLLVLNGCKEPPVEEIKEYEIKFLVDGEIYDVKKYQEGSTVEYPLDPIKEGYDFVGWDKEVSVINENIEVNASFKIKEYVVKFLVDGEVFETKTVKHGEGVTVDKTPEKEGYTFLGWDKEINNITGDLEVNATFEFYGYIVKFVVDGVVIDTQVVPEGGNAVLPKDPIKEGYDFIGWDKRSTNITSNVTITAEFYIFDYKIEFYLDGRIIDIQTVEYGKTPEPVEVELPDGYTFIGWDQDISFIKDDMRVNAIYDITEFVVVFMVDGVEYSKQTVQYGKDATTPDVPVKDGHEFLWWDMEYNNVLSDLTINAVFGKSSSTTKADLEAAAKEIDDYFATLSMPLDNCEIELLEKSGRCDVTWTSTNPEVIGLDGKVVRPFTSVRYTEVILTADISVDDIILSKKINVTVKRAYKDLSKGINAAYNSGAVLTDIAIQTYDIVYYSFLYMTSDTTGNLKNASGVRGGINTYKDKLHEVGGRALFSFVAQSGTDLANLKKIIEDDQKLEKLVSNLLKFCVDNDLDGIDVDWETPGASGGAAYTKLMKKIYEEFKAENPEYLVTSAIGAGPWQYHYYNLYDSAKYHDYINMMSYDMQTGSTSSFQNALFFKSGACLTQCSVDTSVELYNSVGVKNSQIIVGVPFYGRVFSETDGLTKSCSGNFAIKQSAIVEYLKGGFKETYDEDCQVPYLYNSATRQFVTFENSRSVNRKWKYISDNGLAGMMCWNYTQDYQDKLTQAMYSGKSEHMK